jgi:hypothetical protein
VCLTPAVGQKSTFLDGRPQNFHYRLKNQFNSYFLSSLSVFLRDDHRKPADMLADALFCLGRQWARIDCGALAMAAIPSEEFLRKTWKTAGDWESFGWDTTRPPTMTIRVKGEPAVIFMGWWMTLNPNSPPQKHPGIKELRENAETVLDSLVGTVKRNLKLSRPEKGRPRINFGEHAAYLLDHEKQSIILIAKRLCQLPQGASPSMRRRCFDRIRKAANNYYKLLRSDYTTLTSVRVRERIIRIPGNASAVKTE